MTTDNFCFYLPNRLIQTSQTGGQWYSDTSPLSIPCYNYRTQQKNCDKHRIQLRTRSILVRVQEILNSSVSL
jgi:hypothetical protein